MGFWRRVTRPFRRPQPWPDGPPSYPGFQAYPRFLYHPKEAREGKRFETAEETIGLFDRGWYDSPGKFPKPSRVVTFLRATVRPWWEEWKWVITPVTLALGLLAWLFRIFR